jgi:hypothetical protein
MSTVFIWNNKLFTNKLDIKASKTVIGHAALQISDDFQQPIKDGAWFDEPDYVSYWPSSDDAELGKLGKLVDKISTKAVGMRKAAKGHKSQNFFADLLAEEYAPDHVIWIDSGINKVALDAMRKEWKETMEKDGGPNWRADRKNCSRIASRVLRAGYGKFLKIAGLDMNLRFGNLAYGVWTPLMVKRMALELANKVGGKELLWSEFLDKLQLKKAITPKAAKAFEGYKRRAENRGSSSGSTARFTFEGGKKNDSGANNFDTKVTVKFTVDDYEEVSTVDIFLLEAHLKKIARNILCTWMDEKWSVSLEFQSQSPWRTLTGHDDAVVDSSDYVRSLVESGYY